jgi:hypothetical protein
MSMRICRSICTVLLAMAALGGQGTASAQSLFGGSLAEFSRASVEGVADVLAGEVGGEAGKYASWGLKMLGSARELVENVGPLGGDDSAYDPMGLDDGFQAPSACAEDADCQQCYEQAMARIDFNRYYLHRAWSITHQYTKFGEGAMAFGDSASGIHGMAGMSWQSSRPPTGASTASTWPAWKPRCRSWASAKPATPGVTAGLAAMRACT